MKALTRDRVVPTMPKRARLTKEHYVLSAERLEIPCSRSTPSSDGELNTNESLDVATVQVLRIAVV